MIDLKALYPKLVHLMLDTVFVVDRDNHIVFVSDACETLLGYQASELVGTPITDYMHADDLVASQASIIRVMSGQPHVDFRNRYLRKDGRVVHILWSARWYEEEGVRIGVARDVTALRQAEEELRYMAHHDPLTGLSNRALFKTSLESALHLARRHRTQLAVLFLDLNDFKLMNDLYGHAMGDRILCEVARRLEGCIRDSDIAARMGGDEFTVLLTDMKTDDAVTTVVNLITRVIAEPLGSEFEGVKMPSCSVGVARYPQDGQDADTLLSHADSHMYTIKRRHLAVGE